jgi:hypothetical protein
MKPLNDGRMPPARRAIFVPIGCGEAVDHRFDQPLFQPARRLGIGNDLGSMLCGARLLRVAAAISLSRLPVA